MRTALSEEQVAMMGRVGWAEVSQAREREGGVRGERGQMVPGKGEVISHKAAGGSMVRNGFYSTSEHLLFKSRDCRIGTKGE